MAYILTGKKCGVVRLDPKQTGIVTAESASYSSKATSNPIENGSDINDHVVTDPVKYTLTGVTIGGDAAAATLRKMWKERDILDYIGRGRVSSCVITSLKQDISSKNKTGVGFTIQLQVVNITSAGYVASGEQLMSMQDADTGENAAPMNSTAQSSGTNQKKATTADGLKTTTAQSISSSAYAQYVQSYASKPDSSGGPSSRRQVSFSAA